MIGQISPSPDEIRNYVEMRLDRDIEPVAMNKDLRADIRDFAVDASRVFLVILACICQVLNHPDLDLTLVQEQIQRI